MLDLFGIGKPFLSGPASQWLLMVLLLSSLDNRAIVASPTHNSMARAKVGLSGQKPIESVPKKTRQGDGQHTKYASSSVIRHVSVTGVRVSDKY